MTLATRAKHKINIYNNLAALKNAFCFLLGTGFFNF